MIMLNSPANSTITPTKLRHWYLNLSQGRTITKLRKTYRNVTGLLSRMDRIKAKYWMYYLYRHYHNKQTKNPSECTKALVTLVYMKLDEKFEGVPHDVASPKVPPMRAELFENYQQCVEAMSKYSGNHSLGRLIRSLLCFSSSHIISACSVATSYRL
jgi:hypothetical protein